MTKLEKNCEQKLPKSTKWKTRKKKLKSLGYAGAISSALLLQSCGPKDSNVTKISKEHDKTIEHVEKAKDNLKAKEISLKEAQEVLQKARQNLIDAEKEATKAKDELKKESGKL